MQPLIEQVCELLQQPGAVRRAYEAALERERGLLELGRCDLECQQLDAAEGDAWSARLARLDQLESQLGLRS